MELSIRNITKDFGNKRAVKNVSLNLSPGIWGLLGANGSGKTTLMRMIVGILKPTDGEVCYNGKNIIDLDKAYRDCIGYLPQTFGFNPEFKVLDYLQYMACLKGVNKKVANEKIEQFIDIMGLYDVRKKKIKKLSGGMQRRVGIAQALLNEPNVLILDEPTSGLDPGERVYFRNILSELSKDRIVMISTHIVSDIEYIAAQNAILRNGRIIAVGRTEELIKQINGKVFECVVSSGMYERFEQRACVINMKNVDMQHVKVRYIADAPVTPKSKPVHPQLEDLYLWIFRDSTEGRGGLL